MSTHLPRLAGWLAGVAAAILVSTGAAATAPLLFTLTDPAGDDHGDGSLVYPLRDDIAPGELDLRSLSASPDPDGTVFEATFAKPIRRPDRRVIDAGGGTLDSIATLGFYNFNIDIYIDIDGVPGSGETKLLPGRLAEAAPGSAWDRVVCVTPRPYVAQSQAVRIKARFAERELRATAPRVDDAQLEALRKQAEADVNRRVFFPPRVTIAGSTIRFFVPTSFLGGPARNTWGYIVAVSGAEIQERLDLRGALGLAEDAPDRLMILPIAPGRRREAFGGGREDDLLQPPLVDVIVPPGMKQEDVLKDYDLQVPRPVTLTAVVPASIAHSASSGGR